MVEKVFEDIAVAAQRYTGLSRKAIEYGMFQKRIMDRARGKGDGYSPDEWLGLKDFVTEDFERVGTFKEVMNIDQMIGFLQNWSPTTDWEGSFKRVSEYDNVVVLELEERVKQTGEWNRVNTVSIYEFNGDGKLRHLDVYIQSPPGSVEKTEAWGD
jgi:hypothetical protein